MDYCTLTAAVIINVIVCSVFALGQSTARQRLIHMIDKQREWIEELEDILYDSTTPKH